MNFSNARNSTMCRRACSTWPSSSSSSVTLPCPSTRDSGSITTRRRRSGWAAVSSDAWVMSVIPDQAGPELRRAAVDQVGEEFPDGIARRRTAWDVVVHLDHFVQRVDLVERQRQLGVVRDHAVRDAGLGEVHLLQALAEIEVIALRRQATVD